MFTGQSLKYQSLKISMSEKKFHFLNHLRNIKSKVYDNILTLNNAASFQSSS